MHGLDENALFDFNLSYSLIPKNIFNEAAHIKTAFSTIVKAIQILIRDKLWVSLWDRKFGLFSPEIYVPNFSKYSS